MLRGWAAVALMFGSLSASSPTRAAAQAPVQATTTHPSELAEIRGQAFAEEGKFLEAAQSLAEALRLASNDAGGRGRRSILATGAVNAYRLAFEANAIRCEVARVGLRLADEFLADLRGMYGETVTAADDYEGMARARGELDLARVTYGCPNPAKALQTGGSQTRRPPPPPSRTQASAKPVKPGRYLVLGIGLSGGLTVALGITSLATWSTVQSPGGSAYESIREAAIASGVKNDAHTDMCIEGRAVPEVADACGRWSTLRGAYLVTAALTGMFATATGVLTGVLIRDRRRERSLRLSAGVWRRHGAAVTAIPRLGGASLFAGFRF